MVCHVIVNCIICLIILQIARLFMLIDRIIIPRFLFLFVLLISSTIITYGQTFGGNPPSIQWRQVNIPAAKVIYPAGLDSTAIHIADIIRRMNIATKPTIGNQQKQVSIVLQNQTIISNAYVGLAPFRSEFYLTPDQNSFEIGSLPWSEQLAIHEFRHVQQYNNFNVGFSKALHTVFGEGGQALGNDLAIPNWFFEGDAVYNETLVSKQGRGRLPYFYTGYRALWEAGRNYSWMKLRNGSLVDYVPDHYPLGYMLVAYGREKYGNIFWKNVTQDAAAYNSWVYPFQSAVKKYSGTNFTHFRNDALNYFKQQYKSDVPYKANKDQHFIADEKYPAFIDDNTLIYLRTTYDRRPEFVIKTSRNERTIGVRDISIDDHFNYSNGKIVYAAYKPDIRWGYRLYNELVILDVNTGKEQRITRQTKYFSPAFNTDGQKIVAVQVEPSGKNELHILNAHTGKLLSALPNKAKLFYTYPRFFDNNRLVSAVRNSEGQMSLAIIDIKTGNNKYLLPFTYQPIGFTTVSGGMIYFSATSGANDRLFAIRASDGKLFAIDNTNTNKYQPTATAKKMAWVEFTAFGYQLHQADNNINRWIALSNNKIPGNLNDFKITTLKRDSSADLLDKISNKPLPVSNYNKLYHLFNFHSLVPDFSDPNYTITLQGENVLSTFQSQLVFNYNRNEGYKEFGFDAAYGALFPYLTAGFDYTLSRRARYQGVNVYWNERDIYTGFQVPLNLSSGKLLTGLSASSSLHFANTSFREKYQKILDKSYSYLNNTISFNSHIQQAKQNIYPRWGQNITLNYKTTISSLTANQFLANGYFYLPGFSLNHNLVVNLAYQEKGQDNVINFSNNFPFSRGYTAENLHSLNKAGINYHFPIAYPDAGIANTIYFLRIRGNAFFDYTQGSYYYTNNKLVKSNFRSTGAELYFDTKWFNQQPLTFGIRYSHLLDKDLFGGNGSNLIELVLPVSFF